jgi:hypothetical protein
MTGEGIDGSPSCFLHIPKCAGSSIVAALRAALPPGSLAPAQFDSSVFCDFDDFDLMRPEARSQIAVSPTEVRSLARYRAVTGHFALPTLLRITDASSICTIVREPRARLLSLYTYWRTPELGAPWVPYDAPQYAMQSLSRFLSEPRLAPAVDNQICRMLLHGDARFPETGFAAESDIEAIAAEAIELLDQLGFVGVLELGDSAWQGVARLFRTTLNPIKANVTGELANPTAVGSHDGLLSAEALELIEQRNAADLLVYKHVLARAGLGIRERRRVTDDAFARQLVKLGDLVGHSAARAAAQTEAVQLLRSQLQERGRAQAEPGQPREHFDMGGRNVTQLEAELRRRDQDVARLGGWLDAVHSSASWRITAPLRAAKHELKLPPLKRASAIAHADQSLLSGRSVSEVWWFALILCTLIAAADVILSHIVLIALLAAGPFCALLTGRWARTAAVGGWSIALGVLLGVPDQIWDTRTQLVDLAAVAGVAVLSTCAATLIERRRQHQLQ